MWNEVLENLIIVKRSGQRVDFNASKIAIAIKKAFDAVYGETDEAEAYKVFESVLKYINDTYKDRKTITVEDIQDIIENHLQSLGYKDVYKAFHEYRQKRSASRKAFSEKQQHKFVKVVENVTNFDSDLVPKRLLDKFGRIVSSEYTKSYILDNKFLRALEEGNIYIHNLDYFSLGYIPFLHLRLNVNNDDEYLDEFLNNIIDSQNEVCGEVGINNIDILLEEYFLNFYRCKLLYTFKKYFSIKGMLEFINFKKLEESINKISDINIDVEYFNEFVVNRVLSNDFSIIVEDVRENTINYISTTVYRIFNNLRSNYNSSNLYTISVSNKLSLINNIIKESVINYLADNNYIENIHVVFKIIKDLDDSYLSKIASLITNNKNISLSFPRNSYNSNESNEVEYFSNGLRVFENINGYERKSNGRMAIASTSINMARLGLRYLNNNNISNFYEELDKLLELTKNELLLAFETLGNKNKDNYQVLFNGNILGDERLDSGQKIRKVIKAGILNIGLVGLKECVMCFEQDINKQYEFLIKVLTYINNKIKVFSEETKLCFSMFEPSSLSSRKYLIGIDKSIYGIHKNINNKGSYDLIDSSKFISNNKELAKVQGLLNGGSLIEINISSKINNKKIVDIIKELIDDDIGFVKMKVGK